jgi:hypothetical protein
MSTRREFIGHMTTGAALLALGGGLSLEGCWFQTVEADIADYEPALEKAVAGILGIVSPAWGAVLNTFQPIFTAAFAALEKAVADWQAADSTQKPGLVGAIIATLETVQTDLQNVLAAIQVNAPTVYSIAEALAGILLGVLQFFLNKLNGAPATKAKVVSIGAKQLQIEPLNYSYKKFRSVYNAKCLTLGVAQAEI